MKFLTFILTACAYTLIAQTRIPEEFKITERFLALMPTFDASTELGNFAVARKQFFALTHCYDLEDESGKPLATARTRFFAWGMVADVHDPSETKIGWIEEEMYRIFPWAEYRLFNSEGGLAALAVMNFWGTEFKLYHPDDEKDIYATISRPLIRIFSDFWTVKIYKPTIFNERGIDPRLLILLAVLQTDKDARDGVYGEIQDQIQSEIDNFEGRRIN